MTMTDVFHRLHRQDRPLLLPNAWDYSSAAALAAAGFAAVGTTSLGVSAAATVDAARAVRDNLPLPTGILSYAEIQRLVTGEQP